MHGVVVPFLERDDGELRAVLHEDLDVLRDDGGALVVQDHDGLGELLRDNHDVLGGGPVPWPVSRTLTSFGLDLGGRP